MTSIGDGRRALLAIVIVVLAAAGLFGLWHVVVGGLLHGNGRAGLFGAVLATIAGSLLTVAAVAWRRTQRR